MYRSEEDIALLTELLGVLDETVTAHGLSAGTFLVLRALAAHEGEHASVTELAEALDANGDEVAEMLRRLSAENLAEVHTSGVTITDAGRERLASTEDAAGVAFRDHVMDRAHTATVYGLVVAMQTGRFGVDDLLEFIAEGAGPGGDTA